MFEFTYDFVEFIKFILIFCIFSTCSLIFINSKEKYDVVVSTLFLKRETLKNPFFAGYFGIILLFTDNYFSSLKIDMVSELFLHLISIFGLSLILFLIYRIHIIIYASMKLNAKMHIKNK